MDETNNRCIENQSRLIFWLGFVSAGLFFAVGFGCHFLSTNVVSMDKRFEIIKAYFYPGVGLVEKKTEERSLTYASLKHKTEVQIIETLERMEANIDELSANMDGAYLAAHADLEPKLYNFALKDHGAKIVSIEGECSMSMKDYIFSWFRLFNTKNTADEVLKKSFLIGYCFGFKKKSCSITIELSFRAYIKSIAIGHITEAESPSGDVTSAIKDFNVYGLNKPFDKNEVHIGSYSYDIYLIKHFQFFKVESLAKSFSHVKFEFLTNHGDKNYACIYRVGVFGIKA